MRPVAVLVLVAALLTGCSAAPTPEPAPSTAPPSPAPTATVESADLPELEQIMTLLDTAPGDDRSPQTRLGVVLEPDQPQTLTDAREQTMGVGLVRVGCSSEGGVPVTVRLEIGGAEQPEYSAQCGDAPGVSFVTQEAQFDFSTEYTFTVESAAPAVVAIGVVTD